jgi:hypothetical protein
VQQNGRCLLYWTKPDGSQCTVELYVPTFARPTLSEQNRSRFVHFTDDGIEIRNASGAVLRKSGVVAGPTVSRGEMQLMTNLDNLLALWTVQTGYIAPAASSGPTVDLYGDKGVAHSLCHKGHNSGGLPEAAQSRGCCLAFQRVPQSPGAQWWHVGKRTARLEVERQLLDLVPGVSKYKSPQPSVSWKLDGVGIAWCGRPVGARSWA